MKPKKHINLSKLNNIILETVENKFNNIQYWIIADITNHSYKSDKKYHNFDLVEKDMNSSNIIAKISGKAWGNGSVNITNFEKKTGQKFTNNLNVLVLVSVEYHSLYGLSVNVLDIDTNFTLGILEQRKNETLIKLVTENDFIQKYDDNYITKNNQLKFNKVIQRIALISSLDSASGEDFKHTLATNNFGYAFHIDDYFTIVQGENNSKQFLEKLIKIYESKIKYDVVIITRGGGAQTDFLIFDNYNIARAVAKFPIPIITGIGHQKNVTIVDLMANTQTKTPTKAAEFIIAHNRKFEYNILQFQKNIIIKSQQIFSQNLQTLAIIKSSISTNVRNIITHEKDSLVSINQITINTSKSILFNQRRKLLNTSVQITSQPKIILYNRINDIKNIINNLKTFTGQYIRNQKGDLGHYNSTIKIMGPENILKKGYAIIKVNDKITSNTDDIQIGNDIDIILSNMQIKSTVKQKNKYNGTDINL